MRTAQGHIGRVLQLRAGLALVLLPLSGVSDWIDLEQLEQLEEAAPRPEVRELLKDTGWVVRG